MERKRSQRPRKRKSDRLAGILFFLVVSVMIVIALTILRGRLFSVRSISVQGSGVVEDEVIRASGIAIGMPLSQVNETQVRERLEATGQLKLDALGIEQSSGAVVLEVTPRTAAAWILNGGVYLVLDLDGVALRTTREDVPQNGVIVYGLGATGYTIGKQVNAAPDRLSAMKAVLETLRALNGGALIRELDVSDPNNITMNSENGVVIQLGDAKNMENKLRWMISAVNDLMERGESGGTLDVRSGLQADYRSR